MKAWDAMLSGAPLNLASDTKMFLKSEIENQTGKQCQFNRKETREEREINMSDDQVDW